MLNGDLKVFGGQNNLLSHTKVALRVIQEKPYIQRERAWLRRKNTDVFYKYYLRESVSSIHSVRVYVCERSPVPLSPLYTSNNNNVLVFFLHLLLLLLSFFLLFFFFDFVFYFLLSMERKNEWNGLLIPCALVVWILDKCRRNLIPLAFRYDSRNMIFILYKPPHTVFPSFLF